MPVPRWRCAYRGYRSDTFSLPVVSQHRGQINLDPVRRGGHLLAHLQAERRQAIFNVRGTTG